MTPDISLRRGVETLYEVWRREKGRMDTEGVYIDVLLDSVVYVPTLIDSGCTSMAVISEQLVRRHRLETIEIKPRALEGVISLSNQIITRVAWCPINLDGF